MRVAVATAEVYGIDSFAANAPLDEVMLARYLKLDRSSFLIIKDAIQKNTDWKLRTVKDSLNGQFTYNQLRFVIACLIVTLNCKLEAKKRTYQCFSNTDGVGKGHDCLLFFTSHPDAFGPCRRFSDVVVNPRVECPGEISLIHPAFSAVLRPSIDRCTRFFSHFQENHFQMLSINTYFIGTKSESQGMK